MEVLIYISWAVKAWAIPESHVAILRERFPDISFLHCRDEYEALHEVRRAEVAFSSRLTPAMVEAAPNLRWVHSSAAAVEGLLPLAQLARRNIRVSNSRGIQAVPIAEQVLGGLLALARKLALTMQAQQEKSWIQSRLCETDWPWTLHGKSMTVLGLGTIGLEVARLASAFGIRVTGIRRNPEQPRPDFVERVLGPSQLADGLRGCDILVVSAPFVAQTNRLIQAEHLALMNPGAILVNVARGQIVDEAAMISALRSRRLGGAVLDVFDQEPLEPSSPLWDLPNVLITPHSAGFRLSHWDDVTDLFAENLRRYRKGLALMNPVDCAAGY